MTDTRLLKTTLWWRYVDTFIGYLSNVTFKCEQSALTFQWQMTLESFKGYCMNINWHKQVYWYISILRFKFRKPCNYVLYDNTAHPVIHESLHFTHISPSVEVWAHKKVPVPNQEIERSCVCVRGIDVASFGDIWTVPTVWYFLFSISYKET